MRLQAVLALSAACGALLAGGMGSAHAGLIGVNEDATKFAADSGASLFAQMQDIGLKQDVVSAIWTSGRQLNNTDVSRISGAIGAGKARGVKVVIAIYPASGSNAKALGSEGDGAFIDFVKQVVGTFHGTVKDYIVLNEPNRTIFNSPVDPALTAKVLADAYDAIKAIDSGVNVIGIGLSPRGSGNAGNPGAGDSLFPVQFLARLGAAYKALNRSAPLMDAISFHPYPFPEDKAPDRTSDWPTIGMADLARLKQAIWDAFNGTGQKTVDQGLPIHLDEVAYQVPTDGKPGYTGSENVKTVDEATQGAYYAQIVNQVACDPSIASLSFFHFVDESERAAFQSGFLDSALSGRPVVVSVKQALAATSGGSNCSGTPVSWRPETGVVGFDPGFGADGKTALGNGSKVFGFAPTAQEDATFKAGVFLAGIASADAARSLQLHGRLAADAKPLFTVSGKIPAMLKALAKFELKSQNGSFVYAITVTSVTNPNRSETVVSSPFVVGNSKTGATARPPLLVTAPSIAPALDPSHPRYEAGQPLVATAGRWSGQLTLGFAWKRCPAAGGACVTIFGSKGLRYVPDGHDIGAKLRLDVTATNAGGSTTASSKLTPVIAAARGVHAPATAPGAASRPAIKVGARQGGARSYAAGSVLRAFPGRWSGSPTFAFAWQRCDATSKQSCVPVSGTSASTYRLTAADVGSALRVVVTATNLGGSTTRQSDPTPVVTAASG